MDSFIQVHRIPQLTSISSLPFVHYPSRRKKARPNFWSISPAENYSAACDRGFEYAARFAQFLKDNPGRAGSNLLGIIAADIDYKDSSDAKGYWVGFFSYIERLLYAQASRMDVYSDIERFKAYCAESSLKVEG